MLSYQELMNASEVYVTPEGSSTFTSYINNLHPARFGDLYDSLAELFNHFVPLFSTVLTEGGKPPIVRDSPSMDEDSLYPDIIVLRFVLTMNLMRFRRISAD
ncbi:MAG: uncharacterized protein KVP18_004687 [Porospora cf. gigantea A]|uniref:uncharacterized protein n=1 Tax=Porospora cf. gigantea A TaxID=2853593 RepID=UPI00355A6D1B|nr:MAG: hypothetical protein KVP18_004687 [Porospora cf. gigantea A]